jgi:hypothetical protein
MVSTCNFWLNIFPPKDGISRNTNPRELITGVKIEYNKHIQAEFGEYVQVHEEHDNTMHTRTTGAIATKPTGNAQGGHWLYSLATVPMLDRRRWTPLPMPLDVIESINVLAQASQAGMNFTNMRMSYTMTMRTLTLTRTRKLHQNTILMMHNQTTRMMPTMTMMISSQEWILATRVTQTLMPKKPMKITMTALAPTRVMMRR